MNHTPAMSMASARLAGERPRARRRVAIVLFNLGGPDQPSSIKPFLLNLFRDPAILRVPFFVRPILARIIAGARVRPASENYALLGGKSPLLELTEQQASLLERELAGDYEVKCFIAMRYWHPFAREMVRAVRSMQPEHVLLLPLYPQFSTTTTGSSLTDWRREAARAGLIADTTTLCCWFADDGYTRATARLIRAAITDARSKIGPDVGLRILFSAHGLPQVIVDQGDPYESQVRRTADAILAVLAGDTDRDPAEADTIVCFQSRATPQKWLEPSTEHEIERAGHERVALLVVPIAFVSDHSETLVELDIEYREVAEKAGVPAYFRVAAQNADPFFIAALGDLARRTLENGPGLCSFRGAGLCKGFRDCPHTLAGSDCVSEAVS